MSAALKHGVSKFMYQKAVRDKIPDIIKKSGQKCDVEVLNDLMFYDAMRKKLQEEVLEYLESSDIEELADIMEVVYKLCEMEGTSPEELEKIRLNKREERGGFDKNLFLK